MYVPYTCCTRSRCLSRMEEAGRSSSQAHEPGLPFVLVVVAMVLRVTGPLYGARVCVRACVWRPELHAPRRTLHFVI